MTYSYEQVDKAESNREQNAIRITLDELDHDEKALNEELQEIDDSIAELIHQRSEILKKLCGIDLDRQHAIGEARYLGMET